MRVLITGAGGQIGTALVEAFADDDVVATTRAELDLADRDSTMAAICGVTPDVVVHAGAWTAVDACEADPDLAFRVNALGTRHVANAARIVGAHVVYVSTDYVFEGTAGEPYHEWSETNPQSVYGRSKLAGERELDPASTIVRAAWVVGPHGRNFVKTMLRLAGEREEIGVVDDQRGCPTFTSDLAPLVRQLAAARLPGTYHATNAGATTWFEFARAVLTAAGDDPDKVRPVTTAEYGAAAPRPANSVLDNLALRSLGWQPLPPWQDALERTIKELV
ncbi:MAG TPA: dTDP-4-dehydrorhamnose reductase [Acidimicrobiales bacterium]